MPLGLKNAPMFFQRMMDQVLAGAEEYSGVYLDDMAVDSQSWEGHLAHLNDVLTRIGKANLKIRPKKSQLGLAKVLYLGKEVGSGTISPQGEKISCIQRFPLPNTKKELRGYLGLTGYYHRWIPMYASVAATLTDMLRKKSPDKLIWSGEGRKAFAELKAHLVRKPIMRGPDYTKGFILQCDASGIAIGCVLGQQDSEGDYVIAYASRKLSECERRYHSVEQEMLAILFGLEKFKVYLWNQPVEIWTDCNPLKYLDSVSQSKNLRLARWAMILQPYQHCIKHKSGKLNGNCDALSRIEI